MKAPKDKTSLEIVIDKIVCEKEAGIDYFGTDKFYAKIVITDGKILKEPLLYRNPYHPPRTKVTFP